MKIGLIGINKYAKFLNFACNLHIYAFQQYLLQNGYESTILDYKPVTYGNFDMRHPAAYAQRKLDEATHRRASTDDEIAARDKDLRKWTDLAEGYRTAAAEREIRYDKFEAFNDQHLTFTERVYDSDLLEVLDPGFDAYMCVTDVIWQSVPKHLFDRGFLLGSKAFEGKPKISYAASRGASKDYTDTEREKFVEYLSDIDAISVREKDFGDYIERHTDYSAQTVLDPTLLHDKDFWEKVSVKPKEERFVLLYYVMERSTDTIEKAVEYAKHHDLTLVELSDRPLKDGKVTDPDVKHVARYDVGMEEWLGYIQHADAVFTNSFHGCCFSLLFEKTFFVGSRNGQKVPNFLATFGLTDRRFAKDVDVSTLPHEIDYTAVKATLDERRQESADFLLSALKRAEERVATGGPVDASRYDARRRALTYPVRFRSTGDRGAVEVATGRGARSKPVEVFRMKLGAVEYERSKARYINDGTAPIEENLFVVPGHRLKGWKLRFRVDNRWFYLLADGKIATGAKARSAPKMVLPENGPVPHIPMNHVGMVVLEAEWVPGNAAPAPTASEVPFARKVVRKLRRWARRILRRG